LGVQALPPGLLALDRSQLGRQRQENIQLPRSGLVQQTPQVGQ